MIHLSFSANVMNMFETHAKEPFYLAGSLCMGSNLV